ncbi:MAG: ABC transporter ATP-binding protein [candidate division WOR-3 bacterium]
MEERILETVNLRKEFGSLVAVAGVSLAVRKGTIHSVIGPNGAGKTTLFNLITGFLEPSGGEVYFMGKKITGLKPYVISQMGIARSFQIANLFSELTVLENVGIAVQSRMKGNFDFLGISRNSKSLLKDAVNVLERVGLVEKKDYPANSLSHGERKILDIAIALATKPALLLLDEPTSGLVGSEIDDMTKLLLSLAKDTTILIVEHNIDVVLSISHVITVMHYGSVVAQGTPEAIQENRLVQEIYLGGEDAHTLEGFC